MWPSQFRYPDNVCNGLWEYRPDFGGEVWKKGARRWRTSPSGPEGLAAEIGKTGTVVLEDRAARTPSWAGHLETEAERGAGSPFPPDGDEVDRHHGQQLRQVLSDGKPAIRLPVPTPLRTSCRSQVEALAVINDLQMALLATARDDGR